MTSCVTIHSHEAVVLSLTYSYHTVKVPAFEKRIEKQLIFSFPVLPAKWTVGKLHIVWSLDMAVWKRKVFIVPSVVSIFIPRTQIDQL